MQSKRMEPTRMQSSHLSRLFLFNLLQSVMIITMGIIVVTGLDSTGLAEETKKEKPKEVELTYKKDVLPIFRAKCFRCHAGVEPNGDLNLSQSSALITGGESGPAIRIGAAESSLLYEKISSDEMPKVGQKMTAEEKAIIRKWINDGANGISQVKTIDRSDELTDTEWWSFNPPKRPDVPEVIAKDKVNNPIDAFILHKLEENKLQLSPETDKLTLLRRATFDLIGVPPTPEEMKAFLDEKSDDAYSKMVEKHLANPHYGERWGRHWLDVAGYTDSAGVLSEDRPLPFTFRYRDYVIRSFNSDKPYDRFLQEQIAGDELTDYWTAFETMDKLPAKVVEGITATGFLRTSGDSSRPDFSTIKNANAMYYYPTLFDTLEIVCSSTMGLTVQCARCHSHKFDPITQEDYFRMEAVFMSGYRPDNWIPQMNRRLNVATKKQTEAAKKKNTEINKKVKTVKTEQAKVKKNVSEKSYLEKHAKLPVEIRDDILKAFGTSSSKRTEVQKYLFSKFDKRLNISDAELLKQYPDYKTKVDEFTKIIADYQKGRVNFTEIRAFYDLPGTVKTPLLLRGDPFTPGPNVEPGAISTMNTPDKFKWTAPPEGSKTSGRRLAFAKWLTQPDHPLTARVMVNRIWMHHFGVGIVSTPQDFGVSGDPPSHPELLDWLATEFVKNNWSVKHIHRLILNSNTWKQKSRVRVKQTKAAKNLDPDNRLLWRQNLQRLQAEPLRDAILAASGILNPVMFGSPHAVARLKSGEVVVPPYEGKLRRSLYIQVLRLNPDTLLEVFDQPEMSVNCTKRASSTVVTQALTLLNSDLMVKAARAFADRVQAEGKINLVEYAIMTAFSRPATDEEKKTLSIFLDEQFAKYIAKHKKEEQTKPEVIIETKKLALADLCHMLLSANEFAYLD
jgi:Protein of unknown function (DUF1553)/Protein of unknown function (DUF1549)/Planctomycete cytochrome C